MAAIPETVHWRGVNHLALVTPDMDATVRFWHGVLGARLVATIGTPAFRHYFFDVGPGNTIAFFEYAGQHLDMYAKPAGVPYKSHDCEVTDVVDHGFIRSIYFSDPNGMALEASWWTLDATGRPADYADERLFADTDPVPSVTELRQTGALDHTVSTRLVDGIIEDIYRTDV
jgi:catechol 2,3-dioxygenase-like lactoylglutathione lyase family enzyme